MRELTVAVVQMAVKFNDVEANLMANDKVWPAMAKAYREAKGDLADRMLAAHAKLARESGTALIWISHDLSVIAGLAARLRLRNLAFEDLARLPEAARKTFLRNVAARTLLHALKGSDPRVLDALTAVMSPTAAQRMRVDLDTLGPVPVAAIQAAQDEAGASLRRLAAEGAIQFPDEEAA